MVHAAQGKRAETLQFIKELEGMKQAYYIAKIYATFACAVARYNLSPLYQGEGDSTNRLCPTAPALSAALVEKKL